MSSIPVLLGIVASVFILARVIPSDPCRATLGERATDEICDAFNQREGLDEPIIVQFFKYLGNLFQGDFGTDFRGRAVIDTISQRLPVTLKLTVVAVLFETVIGLIAGVLAGIRRNSFFDNLVLVSTTIIVSIPILVLAFVAQYVLALSLIHI